MFKKFFVSVFVLTLFFVMFSSSSAEANEFEVQSVYGGDITSSFTKTLASNAVWMAYYAMIDREQNTYPFGTGMEFANRVKSGGVWDYKRVYTGYYLYNGTYVVGEDIGNMHYGYVGRASGFPRYLLSSAAGAYQIYSGTSSPFWYASYFDDPKDQSWINYGMNMWDYGTLPSTSMSIMDTSMFNLLTPEEKEEIEKIAIENSKKIKEQQKQNLK